MGGGFKVGGRTITTNQAVIALAVLVGIMLLARRAASPTVLTTGGIAGSPGAPPSGPGIVTGPAKLNGGGAPGMGPINPAAAATYTVRQGDTLAGIAQRELGNMGQAQAIADMNVGSFANPNTLIPGSTLQLPPVQYNAFGQPQLVGAT